MGGNVTNLTVPTFAAPMATNSTVGRRTSSVSRSDDSVSTRSPATPQPTLAKLFAVDCERRPRIRGQDIHVAADCDRVDEVIRPVHLLAPYRPALDRRVITMIILRTESEACHRAVLPRSRQLFGT
jgi:hypothetical protein